MTKFHADEYVNFLRLVTPDNMEEYSRQLQRCAFCRKQRISLPQSTWARIALSSMASTSSAKSQPAARSVHCDIPLLGITLARRRR